MYFNPSDQEAYVLTIHRIPFRIVTARFSSEYLSHVPSPTMPLDQHLHVRRSRCYEMENPGDRVEALKARWRKSNPFPRNFKRCMPNGKWEDNADCFILQRISVSHTMRKTII